MKKIRLGFIGTGGMGQCAHIRNYATLPNCELVALAELRPELARAVAARYGVPQVYANDRDLLAHAEIDALVAIQQFTAHGKLLPAIVERGLPMIIEKPLARSSEVAVQLAALAAKCATPLYVAYHTRSDPATMAGVALLREWQRTGAYGQLRYIRVTMPPGNWTAEGFSTLVRTSEDYPSPIEDAWPAGYEGKAAKDHFAFVNYYIHQINLLRHLFGEDYSVTFADPNGRVMGARSASGVTGILEMAPYHTTVDWQESALIGFDKGWIRIDLPAPLVIDRPGTLTMFRDNGAPEGPTTASPVLPFMHAMRSQAANFLKAVAGEPTPLCRADEAMRDIATADEFLRLQQKNGGISLSF